MLKTFSTIGAFILALSLTSQARGQALPTASAPTSLQVGAGYSIASPDYGQKTIQGGTVFADYDFGLHFGVEADAHFINLKTPTHIAENSYLIGPRFILPFKGRFNLYGKALAGYGNFRVLENTGNQKRFDGFYFAYSLGGGLDYRASHHIVVRLIDVEDQKWPSYGTNGLTPIIYTFGVAYHLH
ncbi:MAG: hypothetical protein NVSMB62_08030 [Acidobacteriaceae bacterium]